MRPYQRQVVHFLSSHKDYSVDARPAEFHARRTDNKKIKTIKLQIVYSMESIIKRLQTQTAQKPKHFAAPLSSSRHRASCVPRALHCPGAVVRHSARPSDSMQWNQFVLREMIVCGEHAILLFPCSEHVAFIEKRWRYEFLCKYSGCFLRTVHNVQPLWKYSNRLRNKWSMLFPFNLCLNGFLFILLYVRARASKFHYTQALWAHLTNDQFRPPEWAGRQNGCTRKLLML